jgi:glycine/D-amino acid oxidase-like deaminating enzyme
MLAPGSARLLRQMILKEPLGVDAAPFNAERFAGVMNDKPCPALI